MTAPFDPDAWLEACAPGLGLSIRTEDRESVLANLRILAEMAARLDRAELDDRQESAMVFRP